MVPLIPCPDQAIAKLGLALPQKMGEGAKKVNFKFMFMKLLTPNVAKRDGL